MSPLARFFAAVVDGQITARDLTGLTDAQVRDAWRQAVIQIRHGRIDARMRRALEVLQQLDPTFPAASFLLGLVCHHLGDLEAARAHFQRQTEREDREHYEVAQAHLSAL